jgi:hypothetical protein
MGEMIRTKYIAASGRVYWILTWTKPERPTKGTRNNG